MPRIKDSSVDAIRQGADFVALSFVRSAADMEELREHRRLLEELVVESEEAMIMEP